MVEVEAYQERVWVSKDLLQDSVESYIGAKGLDIDYKGIWTITES